VVFLYILGKLLEIIIRLLYDRQLPAIFGLLFESLCAATIYRVAQKVSHYQVLSLNCIKNRHWG